MRRFLGIASFALAQVVVAAGLTVIYLDVLEAQRVIVGTQEEAEVQRAANAARIAKDNHNLLERIDRVLQRQDRDLAKIIGSLRVLVEMHGGDPNSIPPRHDSGGSRPPTQTNDPKPEPKPEPKPTPEPCLVPNPTGGCIL